MKVRGTQREVKPVEVNVDTVYVRTNIVHIDEADFEGWEYDENTYSTKEYIEQLSNTDDLSSVTVLVSMLMSEVDFLRNKIEILEGGSN